MKKFKLFFALFAMLALGVTNAWGDVTCDFTVKSASHSNYTDSWNYGNFTVFGGANNNGNWAYVKMGGKSTNLANANPVYIVSPQMTSSISKVQVSIFAGSLAKTGMSVNSWGVYVYSDENMTTQIDYVAGGTIDKTAKVFEFTPSEGTVWAANNYYKVSFDLANTTTTNGIIWLDKITFVESAGEEGDEETVKYTITTAVNDEKMGSVSGAGTYAENAQVTLTATAKPGYKFVQWNDGSTENPLKITVTQDSTYTATFQALDIVTVADAMALGNDKEFVLNQFTVVQVQGSNTYIKDASGYGVIYKSSFGLKAGDVVESMPGKKSEYNGFGRLVPLVTKADLAITTGEIPEPEEFTTAPIAKDIYKYVKIDSVTVFEGAFKLLDGTKINYYNATLTEGHIYNIVGSVGHYNGTLQIVIASSTDITPKYTVTATAENGTVTGDGEYVQGTSATLTATPAEGYEFTCWTSGNNTVSTDNPLILTVSADTALVANFAKKTFTIDVNVTPAESGTVTGLAERGVYEYGATATLTATPADNYEFVFWAAGEDTLSTEATYSFEVKDNAKLLAVFKYTKCTPLNAPVVTYTTTYNSATLTWDAVDNAVAYLVTVGNFFNEVTETTYTAIRLEAATEYTYSVQAISGDKKAYCDSEATYGALTTAEAPVATLTLSENGETRNLEGDFRLNEIVTLPTTADECSKTFVGWDSNAECTVAPEYAPGAEYQLNELTQTLYAVYADNKPGETVSIKYSGTTTTNMKEGNNATTLGLDENEWTVIADKGKASNNVGLNKEGTIRLYWNADGSNTLTITASKTVATVSLNMKNNYNNAWVKVGENTITPSTAGVYTIDTTTFVIGNANTSNVQVHIYSIEVTLIATEYTNYSTTCPAAPVVEVAPAEVTATVEGATGKLTVEYENVLLDKVAIDLFNDKKCTEAFTGDWLTATLDADYNITYTVAASTLYTEREAYILLTAPAVDGTEPATALIPVTQAGKEAVFASLEELLANVTPTKEGINVTVTLTDEEIVEIFVTSKGYRNGVNLNAPYQNGTKKIQIFCYDVPESWVKGGKVSGTITCPWKDYNGTWELCPKSWDELTYTAPTTTALDNAVVAGKTTKMIINGQMIIIKNGVKYNAQGAILK